VQRPHDLSRLDELRILPATPLQIGRNPARTVVENLAPALVETVKSRCTSETRLCQQRQKGMHKGRMRTSRSPHRFANPDDPRRDTPGRKIDLVLHGVKVTTVVRASAPECTPSATFTRTIGEFVACDMELTIRRYEHRDHAAVLRLHRDGLEQMGADAGPGPWDADLDNVEGSYLDTAGEFLVALLGDELIAMGALRRVSETTADLKRLRVRRELQGKGIGERIARHLVEHARELGFTRLTADTTTRQLPAQRLLSKLGFVEQRRQQFKRFELIYYERSLDAPH